MAHATQKKTGAEDVRWNLADLYPGVDSPELKADLETLADRIESFADQYRGRVAALSAQELHAALEAYETIQETINRLGTYAFLNWVTDTADSDAGRFLTTIQQRTTAYHQELLFFELEWKNAPEEVAALAHDPALQDYEHFLETSRLTAPYTLSEPEERVVSELSLTGVQGWNRYFSEVTSKARYELDGEELTQSQILQHMYAPDRELRRRAADAVTAGLQEMTHTTTYIFNMIGQHKHSMDKMRGYKSWIASRNLANEVDDETVEALIEAVTGRYDIVHRYYELVRRLFGYDELYEYDRYAPVLDAALEYDWEAARQVVLDAYGDFDPHMADIAASFFDKRWIDAALAPNKRGGAFSHGAVPSAHPYILMNYTGESDSVMTLAHELGHGVHQYLARQVGHLQAGTPLTTAEMASTFGEMLVFERLLAQTDDPRVRLSMRLKKIASTFATVFRQVAMNRFEDGFHTSIRREGQLTTEQLSEIWMDTQKPMFGDSLTLRDDYAIWWSYIPHFLGVPGYVYAYAFGELLVWTLYAIYQQGDLPDFPANYLEALAKGGSMWPHELLAPLGVDLQDPAFWNEGLTLIEDMVALAEDEAAALDYKVQAG